MPKPALADRLFLAAEGVDIPQHVACLGIFTKPPGAAPDYLQRLTDDLREIRTFTSPLNYRLKTPRLRSIAPSYEVLADDEIDLDYHVRLDGLAEPGGERQLGVLVSRLHSYPLDLTRPLWEFHLIDGLSDNRFAMYFKVHHAVMDGVAGSQRLQQMVEPDPASRELRSLWAVGRPEASRRSRGRPNPVRAFVSGARTAGGLSRAAAGMMRGVVWSDDPDLARPFAVEPSVMNGRVGPQRRVATQSFEFSRFRALAKAAGVTHNDVFLAVCAGGLRRYLESSNDLPGSPLIAGTPVNIRTVGEEGATNAFTMTVMSLATDIDDPVERLAAIHRSSTLAKDRLGRLAPAVIKNYAGLFMGPFVGANLVGLGGRVRPPYNVVVSNVPGPVEPQYMAGARLEAMYPIGMLYHGVGLFIAALTVSGRVCIGFTGDRDSLPHLQNLAVETGLAYEELEAALGGRT